MNFWPARNATSWSAPVPSSSDTMVPAVRGALIDLLRLARTEKLAELLIKIDPEGDLARLAKVA